MRWFDSTRGHDKQGRQSFALFANASHEASASRRFGTETCLERERGSFDARFKNARIGPYGFFETLPDWEVDR